MTSDEQLVHIDKSLLKKMEMLLQALENIYPSTKELIWKSFLKGIFIGLGTTIGVSIVLAALTYVLTSLRVFPVFNDIIESSRVEDILLKN